MYHHFCQKLEVFCEYRDFIISLLLVQCENCEFLISLLVVLIRILIVGFNSELNDKELFIRLCIHIVTPFWNFET